MIATFSNAALVERLADGADAAVHHVRRRDDVGAGGGVRDGRSHELLDRRIVGDLVVDDDAAVAVVGVLAQADVGDDEHRPGAARLIARTADCTGASGS